MSLLRLLEPVLGTITTPVHPPPDSSNPTDADLLAQADAAAASETIVVTGEAPSESASSVHLTRDQLQYRSRTQPSDLLRQVPGLVVSQHAGGGKSDQYFI